MWDRKPKSCVQALAFKLTTRFRRCGEGHHPGGIPPVKPQFVLSLRFSGQADVPRHLLPLQVLTKVDNRWVR